MVRGMTFGAVVLFLATALSAASAPTVVLGRPTDSTVTLNVLSSSPVELYVEHGATPGSYPVHSAVVSLRAGEPREIDLDGLAADSDYTYRLQARAPGEAAFTPGETHAFHTQRARGSTFTFAIEADPHLDPNTSPELFARSLTNVLSLHPDFLVDLGDTFMSEKLAPTRDLSLARYKLLRSSFELACHLVPLFLVPGNHEGEAGWLLDGTADNVAVWTTNMRKAYFPGPEPGWFYSGDTTAYPFIGLRQAIYSFEWGDALFVMLDPFWNTPTRGTGLWTWTLGREQYLWLENVLQQSRATFKFVFIHHLTGGLDASARGGSEAAPFFEWGGRSLNGQWEFDSRRQGWGRPIHQLLADNGVSAVFHGHDHFYASQTLDGIVYQEVPQPGWPGRTLPDPSIYGYVTGTFLPSSGDLLVTVAPDHVTVDYVSAVLPTDETPARRNGAIVHSYTIDARRAITPRKRPVRPSNPIVSGATGRHSNDTVQRPNPPECVQSSRTDGRIRGADDD